MADEETKVEETTAVPTGDPAYIMGFSVNHYTDRTVDELEEEGFTKANIAYARKRLAEQGLEFKTSSKARGKKG